ncbi:MAG: DNA repair protein RadA [Gammaproteobacteria bacterium]|nr:DNA repair protein RadA [Gammaproteobacteria bacterium]
MAKKITRFVCADCGSEHSKWAGQCQDCSAWNTVVEFKEPRAAKNAKNGTSLAVYAGATEVVRKLSDVKLEDTPRFSTNNSEFDRVLGGGLCPGSVVLLAGTPGAGKSTLTLQTLCEVSHQVQSVYISAEESLNQIAMRAARLNLPTEHLHIAVESDVLAILAMIEKLQVKLVVIDSLQAMFHPDVQGASGGVSQLRECMQILTQYAKQNDVTLLVICHTTKDGSVAGPRVVEHIGDAMLMIEVLEGSRFRELRAQKNRFGSTNELGLLAMMPENGYLKAVTNPAAIFLNRSREPHPGSMVAALWEGSRSMLVEIQSLVVESNQGNPRRLAVGLDQNRLNMLVAILMRHGNLAMFDQELYVNLVGGLKTSDPSTDLPLILSMVSSFRDRAIPQDWMAFGEVGLSGEIRPVPSGLERINQAARQGFKYCVCPAGNASKSAPEGITVIPVETLIDALDKFEEI